MDEQDFNKKKKAIHDRLWYGYDWDDEFIKDAKVYLTSEERTAWIDSLYHYNRRKSKKSCDYISLLDVEHHLPSIRKKRE